MAITVDVKDTATAAVNRLRENLRPQNVNPIVARAGWNAVRAHLFGREQSHPNKNSFPRQHFWARCARSTQYEVGVDTIRITVNEPGARLQLEGGTVEAGKHTSSATGKPTTMLTIPARAEAYGKRAVEFHNLEYIPNKRGGGRLVETQATEFKTKRGKTTTQKVGGAVMFWCVPSVTIHGDSTVMPPASAISKAVEEALSNVGRAKR